MHTIAAGTTLAASFDGGWVETWDLGSGHRLSSFQAVPEMTFGEVNRSIPPRLREGGFDSVPITAQTTPIALDADGTVVAVGGSFLIRFFETSTGQQAREDLLIRLPDPGGGFHNSVATASLGFAEDDGTVYGASITFEYTIDLATGETLGVESSENLNGQNPPVATASGVEIRRAGQIRFLRDVGPVEAGASISSPVADATAVAVAPDDRLLAIASRDGISLLSLDGRRLLADVLPRRGAISTAIDHTGNRVDHDYSWGLDHTFEFRRRADGSWAERRRQFDGPASYWIPRDEQDFESTYDLLATFENVTYFVDPRSDATFGGVPTATAGVRISETEVALGLNGGGLLVAEVPNGREMRLLNGPVPSGLATTGVATYRSLDHSPQLGRLTAVFHTGMVGSWDISTWEFATTLEQSRITALRYHPDGEVAVTADDDGRLQVREAASLRPIGGPLVGHTGRVGVFDKAIYFFGDDYLVTLGQDQTLRLWNWRTGAQIGDPLPTSGPAAFDAHPAQWSVVTAVDTDFLLWNYRIDEWLDIACRAAGRNMTAEEWKQFGPQDEPYHPTCPQWPALG